MSSPGGAPTPLSFTLSGIPARPCLHCPPELDSQLSQGDILEKNVPVCTRNGRWSEMEKARWPCLLSPGISDARSLPLPVSLHLTSPFKPFLLSSLWSYSSLDVSVPPACWQGCPWASDFSRHSSVACWPCLSWAACLGRSIPPATVGVWIILPTGFLQDPLSEDLEISCSHWCGPLLLLCAGPISMPLKPEPILPNHSFNTKHLLTF